LPSNLCIETEHMTHLPAAVHAAARTAAPTAQRRTRSPVALAVAIACGTAVSAWTSPALAACTLTAGGGTLSTWNVAGDADWTTAADWTGGTVPNAATANVCITNGTSAVSLTTGENVGSLQIGSGNALNGAAGSALNVNGNIINDGAISFTGGSGANTVLSLGSNATLSGGGTLTLNSNVGGSGTAFIQQATGGITLTNQSTIQGSGIIGNGGLTFVNGASGVVNANQSGQSLILNMNNTADAGNALENAGLLEATNGGILQLNSIIINNSGQAITANGAGSTLNLSNSTINGGALTASGGGTMQTQNSATLNGVTLNGTYLTGLGTETSVSGTNTANAVLQVNANGSGAAVLVISGATTLQQGGTVNLVSSNGGTAYIQQASGGITLTNQGLIQGAGVIGNGGLTFVNGATGVVNANQSGQSILLNMNNTADAGNALENYGVLEATNGGALQLNSIIVNNNSGQSITATGSGSALNLSNTTINGGALTASGGATMQNQNTATLNGVTLNGAFLAGIGTSTNISGTITTNGSLQVASGNGANTVLGIAANTTLQGGVIQLSNSTGLGGASYIEQNEGSLTLTNNATIQGAGVIGNGGLTFINTASGVVNANVAGQSMLLNMGNTVDAGGALENSGVLEATNGGTLQLTSLTINNVAGQSITATGAGSALNLSNATINGGALTASNGATMQNQNSATLNGVTLNGTFQSGSGTLTNLSGTTTVNGNLLATASGGSNTILNVTGATTLQGPGTVTLASSGAGNVYIQQNNGGITLTNATTIQGSGIIGNGGLTLINAAGGTINASSSGQLLTINAQNTNDAHGEIANSGTLSATAGTLAIVPGVYGSGTILTSGSGVVTLGAASSAGTLVNNGTTSGAALVLGANNITVSSDYQNANFGTGNSFNKLANVSSSGGQILAAGDVAQAITGANVTNGTSATATLTIGNVHVGQATTYDFSVANTGSTGPALRGAVQTNVNGATISDSALGVTAQNYGPVAAGSQSGPIAVTYTATSAGALAALTGTNTLHIANNFQNVAEQNLDIVVGSGAGAYNLAAGNTNAVTVANQRVGGTTGATLAVQNTAPSGAYTEALNATFAGSTGSVTSTAGSIQGGAGSGVAGGATNNSALTVGIDTSSSGLKSGSVTLNYVSNGTGSSGLGNTGVGTQVVSVTGGVYQAASGSVLTAPLNFGTVQVGQSISQALSIRNTATGASGYVEDLNASFGASSGTGAGAISGSGAVNGLVAGGTDSSHMTVSVNTASAGTINGQIAVNFYTAGTVNGVSDNLGVAAVGSSSYGVSGTIQTVGQVVNQASPLVASSVNLGNVRIGGTFASQGISVTNQSVGAPQAALDATISSSSPVTNNGGVISLLGPGATDTSSLQVGYSNTASAGHVSGTATVGLVSDAANIGGCSPNCTVTLASQAVTVSGSVYQTAVASLPASVNLGTFRVGGTQPTAVSGTVSIGNTQQAGAVGFQEGLDVATGATTGQATVSGGIANLAAGNTSSGVTVGLTGLTSGANGGTVTVALASDGATTSHLTTLSEGTAQITVSGTGYQIAQATVNPPSPINLGIVHVGDAAPTAGVSITNSASGALVDSLLASASGATGPFSASGSLGTGGLAAGQTSSSGLSVGLSTATAGTFSGTASFATGSHDGVLADLALGSVNVAVEGQVNYHAQPTFALAGGQTGTLTAGGVTVGGGATTYAYALNLGNVTEGTVLTDLIELLNGAPGQADSLGGSFGDQGLAGLTLSGFNGVAGLGDGQGETGSWSLNTETLGAGEFTDVLTFDGTGSNASGFAENLDAVLTITGDVVPGTTSVPEPSTLSLAALGAALTALSTRFRRRRALPVTLRG